MTSKKIYVLIEQKKYFSNLWQVSSPQKFIFAVHWLKKHPGSRLFLNFYLTQRFDFWSGAFYYIIWSGLPLKFSILILRKLPKSLFCEILNSLTNRFYERNFWPEQSSRKLTERTFSLQRISLELATTCNIQEIKFQCVNWITVLCQESFSLKVIRAVGNFSFNRRLFFTNFLRFPFPKSFCCLW